ncbi:hypothetical protein Airi01_028100 [Actinoallomurus iriomotensis]|uniref:YGGT family protein n=1 Tax=Actinoallomurus iriomotensis TaxID=478107 RepID=A0A9W6VJW8_9ACTN|nr:hypothetical protein Airi01_028100 [Actinoallomurus iriomotensis]
MAKRREESEKTTKTEAEEPGASGRPDPAAPTDAATATRREPGHRARDAESLRTGVRRVSGRAADLVRILAMIICVLLALHIAFVVFSANRDNSIVRTVNDWADWFAWRFRDMFVPKDERVGVLVNYGIAAVVYLIAGRVAAALIRRIR